MLPTYLNPLRVLIGVGRRAEVLRARRTKHKRYASAKALLGSAEFPLKVNVGCGHEPFPGWINLDSDLGTRPDIVWDVTDGLPFPDASCAFIYSEHFLEHIHVQNACGSLRSAFDRFSQAKLCA
jgi:hypothetical protein